MNENKYSAIVISASSDIGSAMCRRWLSGSWEVSGTYRTESKAVDELCRLGAKLVHCDLLEKKSIIDACSELKRLSKKWNVLILCPGSQEPVGPFIDSDFDEWERSIMVNFTGQMQFVRELLPFRNTANAAGPCVLFFAGGGTNNAVRNYSAYTISKIALIKMCELLDAEIPDTRFAIIGPGWVKTKIHDSTLKAGDRAGENYKRTLIKLAGDEFTPMEEVLDCCDWIIDSPREAVSGRNFSVVFDKWGTKELEKKLLEEEDMYKLRRCGNDRLVRKRPESK